MHVIIANPFDLLPWESKRSGRYSLLAEELTRRGHDVLWLTANFLHSTKRYRKHMVIPTGQAVEVVTIHVPPYVKNISLARLFSHDVYARGLQKALRSACTVRRPDVVIASIPPTGSARSAMQVCADFDIRGLLDMQDAWPKVLEMALPPRFRRCASAVLLRQFQRDVELAAQMAAGLVAVSPEYLSYLSRFRASAPDVPHVVFPLGFDTSAMSLPRTARPTDNATGPLVVTYVGNFGRFYDLETVIEAARICTARDMQFILIGDGPKYRQLTRLVQSLGLSNVRFTGRLAFEDASKFLQRSHVGLVPITADWPPNTPNKVFDYLFFGLPIVSSVTGILEQILQKERFGLQYEAGVAASLADALIALDTRRDLLHEMGCRGLQYAQANMDGRTIYRRYADFIEQIALPHGPFTERAPQK